MAEPSVDANHVYLVGAGTPAGFPVLVGRLKQSLAPPAPDALFESKIAPVFTITRCDVRRIVLPAHLQDAKVTLEHVYKDEDENMRVVREVNEDDGDELLVKVEARVPAVIEKISVSVDVEIP